MNDNYKRRDLIVFAREHLLTDPNEMIADAKRRFPGVSTQELRQAFEVVDEDNDEKHREYVEQHEKEAALMKQMGRMFEGLPAETTFDEAVKIKAAQGDQWANGYLAFEKSPARRTYCALAEAAYAAHPQFEQRDDGVIYWLGGEGNDPSEAALIDWFQQNYPAEAREIEKGATSSNEGE
jgi:hypothetical protein